MKKVISILLILVVIVGLNITTVFADENATTITFKTNNSDYGVLYNEDTSQDVFQYTCTVDKNADNYFGSEYSVNTIYLVTNDELIASFTPKAKEGYAFLGWEFNGVRQSPYDFSGFYNDVTVEAVFVKCSKFYWGIEIDNIEQLEDRTNKFTFIISEEKSSIDHYDELANYINHTDYGDYPSPYAGETNGIFLDYSPVWSNAIYRSNNVKIIGNIDAPSTSRWFAVGGFHGLDLTLDLEGLNNVQDTSYMFENSNFNTLKIINFDTSKVTCMSGMFQRVNATTIDISSFDTSSVKDMSNMFANCELLNTIVYGENFNTKNVLSFAGMFASCSSLEQIDTSIFDTSSATSFAYMFNYCTKLKELDLSNFDTSNVTSLAAMFCECTSLESVDLSSFNTINVVDMNSTFYSCEKLKSLDLSSFRTPNLQSLNCVFAFCYSLEYIDVSFFDTSKVSLFSELFEECRSLKTVDLTSFSLEGVHPRGLPYLFSDTVNLETIYASENFDLSSYNSPTAFSYYNANYGEIPWGFGTKLVGEHGSYFSKEVDDSGHPVATDDIHCMYTQYGRDAVTSLFGRLDDPDNGKPGYFTRGYHVVYNLGDGKYKKDVGKVGDVIQLLKPEKDGYTFLGWSDGDNTYTDTFTLIAEDVNLDPIWRKDINIELNIEDTLYNGEIQNMLPRTLIDLPETYYKTSYTKINENGKDFYCIDCGTYNVNIILSKQAIDAGYLFLVDGEKTFNYSIDFKIVKRPLNIIPDSKTIYIHSSIPELTYTQDGLIEGHKLELSLKTDADNNKTGKYSVMLDSIKVYDSNMNDVSSNYDVSSSEGIINVINKIPYNPPKTGIK